MAFGNATKGYVKKHGGSGGGGGTTDYEELLNKPSINGVELLGDKKIGTLSGDIKMTLSDVSNMNLSNVADAQTLIFNALNKKWENKTLDATVEVMHYVGDGTRSRVHNVGEYKALKIFGISNTAYTESSFIVPTFTYYWADMTATKDGSVIHGDGTIALSNDNTGLEFNENNVDYYIVIIR